MFILKHKKLFKYKLGLTFILYYKKFKEKLIDFQSLEKFNFNLIQFFFLLIDLFFLYLIHFFLFILNFKFYYIIIKNILIKYFLLKKNTFYHLIKEPWYVIISYIFSYIFIIIWFGIFEFKGIILGWILFVFFIMFKEFKIIGFKELIDTFFFWNYHYLLRQIDYLTLLLDFIERHLIKRYLKLNEKNNSNI